MNELDRQEPVGKSVHGKGGKIPVCLDNETVFIDDHFSPIQAIVIISDKNLALPRERFANQI